MKKKSVVMMLTVAMLMGIFTGGCSKSEPVKEPVIAEKTEEVKKEEVVAEVTEPKEDEPVTITYWQHSSQARDDMMQILADKFMEENKHITVEMEFIPEADYTTKLISTLASNAAPDVMQIQSGMIPRLAEVQSIQPLDSSVLSGDEVSELFIPATVDGLKYDGEVYGLPTDTQTIVLYWNKKLASEAGLDAENGPQTWDEMLDWAKKLTKFDGDTMVQSGWGEKGSHPETQAIIAQYGGKMVDDTGKYVFADDVKSIEAVRFLVDAYRKEKVYDLQFMKNWQGFRQGMVAIMLGHPAMFGNLKQTAPDVELGIGLIPAHEGKRKTIVTSWAYVLSNNAESVAATKWIEFLTSEEVQKAWTLETGELPARKSLLDDAELTSDPQLKILLDSLKESDVASLQMGSLNKIWGAGIEEIFITDIPLEDGLKKMQDELNAEIGK